MSVALAAFAAVLLDACWGEPRIAHPLVAFGRWARAVETRAYASRRLAGALAWGVAVLPWVVYLALPASVHPLLILLPAAALLGIATDIAAATFKKYL